MRYVRLIVGSTAILASLYIIVAEQVTGASSNAFVNAQIVTVRAPIAGDLDIPSRSVGAEVSQGTTLMSLTDVRSDRVHLDDLVLDRARVQADIDRLAAQNLATQARLARLDVLQGIETPSATDQASDEGFAEEVTRSSNSVLFSAMPDNDQAALDAQLDAAIQALIPETAVEDSQVYANWRATTVDYLIQGTTDLAAAEMLLTAYDARIAQERQRLVYQAGVDIVSPVNGIVWEQLATTGVNVQRGDPVMRIADCGSAVVSLSVSELVYNRLQTGDPAIFRLTGSKSVMRGTVARLAGSGAAEVYNNMAVKPSHEHLERFDVTLIVQDLRGSTDGGCQIGRTGRVFFDGRPLDFLRNLLG